MAFRKSANVNYPTLYASEEEAAKDPKKKQYNCAQRAHQNTLENLPALLALTAYFGACLVLSMVMCHSTVFGYGMVWQDGGVGGGGFSFARGIYTGERVACEATWRNAGPSGRQAGRQAWGEGSRRGERLMKRERNTHFWDVVYSALA